MPWPDKKPAGLDASEKNSFGRGVFKKCDGCGETLTAEALEKNFEVCPQCGQHHKLAAPRWRYDDEFLTLLDSPESALPLARRPDLSDEQLAREIFRLSEGLIGEIVAVVTAAAVAAAGSGAERITRASIDALDYVPVSRRRRARLREGLL